MLRTSGYATSETSHPRSAQPRLSYLECPVHACRAYTSAEGRPCRGCLMTFGPYIKERSTDVVSTTD